MSVLTSGVSSAAVWPAAALATRIRRQRLAARLVATRRTQASGESQSRTIGQRCQALANASCAMSCASAMSPVSAYPWRTSLAAEQE